MARTAAVAAGLAARLHGESSALHSSLHRTQSAPPSLLLAVGRTMRGAIHDESPQQRRSTAHHAGTFAAALPTHQFSDSRENQRARRSVRPVGSKGHRAQLTVPASRRSEFALFACISDRAAKNYHPGRPTVSSLPLWAIHAAGTGRHPPRPPLRAVHHSPAASSSRRPQATRPARCMRRR